MQSFRGLRTVTVFCLLLLYQSSHAIQNTKPTISSEQEIAQDVGLVTCKNGERLKAVRALFVKMGVQAENVLTEKRHGVENVLVRKQGKGQGTIIVGAHYDKAPDGCGAIDNWTGIVALAHIYRSLKDVPLQKTLVFVAFGKEEQGLLGSKSMARSIKRRMSPNTV